MEKISNVSGVLQRITDLPELKIQKEEICNLPKRRKRIGKKSASTMPPHLW
jgi:hypothetical protein